VEHYRFILSLTFAGNRPILKYVKCRFRWNEWNRNHVQKHGCTAAEAEAVIRGGGRGYPRKIGGDKYEVVGRGQSGRFVRVIFVFSPPGVVYVIHAMPR
jgi:uncharacterized DUF497 family protein